ncbi:MAG: hypothetical protein ABMA64_30225 [Myxococcota bacterium]
MGRDEDGAVDEDMDIDPDDVPTVLAPAGEDPMERARAAIRAARLARGIDPDEEPEEPEPLPTDPIARSQAVLDRAASARAAASKGGKAGLAREARARDELRRLKALIGDVPAAPDDVDSAPTPAQPKKRKL